MVSKVRTIDFLPDIFRTKSNEQFLSASLDQLVQPPNYKKVQGYIGAKFGYGVDSTDSYVKEPNDVRTNYQLEQAVVFMDTDTQTPKDALTYPGLLDSMSLQGSDIANNNSLFENDFYSWDSYCDLDKIVNYSRYYWLPDGPDAVTLTTDLYLENIQYGVKSGVNTYTFSENDKLVNTENPVLTLIRGGTYTFTVDQKTNFWIQTMPGVSGVTPSLPNISTRDVYGITNNGSSSGVITFMVPESDAQSEFMYPNGITADVATLLNWEDINGKPLFELSSIDGVSALEGKTVLFINQPNDASGYISNFYDSVNYDIDDYESGFYSNLNSWTYRIVFVGTADRPVIKLVQDTLIPTDKNITIQSGYVYATRKFVRNTLGDISLLPVTTADIDQLYYQDSTNPDKVGIIRLVDNSTQVINVNDIIGSKTYQSPNGIMLSNGLKIQFTGNVVPEEYKQGQYYVEGVGTSIQLIPTTDLLVTEDFTTVLQTPFDEREYDTTGFGEALYVPEVQDYITINRQSINKNAWARSNRWFHEEVINTSINYNTSAPLSTRAYTENTRARRPIIEFYPNLKLFNQGSVAKAAVDFIDFSTTDAFADCNGKEIFNPDGASSQLFDGCRIIFANDEDANVRNKIYEVSFIFPSESDLTPIISLTVAPDGNVDYNNQVQITKGETYTGHTVWFDGSNWHDGQLKSYVNQPPKFDVFDNNGISFSDTDFYDSSDFDGCTLFEYTAATGVDDPILGFPIKYSSINNLNDISFTISMNSQTFNYVDNYVSLVKNVQDGYVHDYTTRTDYTRKIGWVPAVENSFQYQVFAFTYNGSQTFTCDIAALTENDTLWNSVVVYVDNVRQPSTSYSTTINETTTVINLIDIEISLGTQVDIMIYSNQVSKNAYYQTPTNLDHNPFNAELGVVNFGDIKGHYKSICNNVRTFAGNAFGSNNFRDLGNVISYGTTVIQNSASIVPAATFLRNKDANILNALQFNSNEYLKFKNLLVDTVSQIDFNPLQTNASILDAALTRISDTKSDSNPFFWSDMVPAKTPTVTNTYSFNVGISTSNFPLSRIYKFNEANYYSVLVYLTRKINGTLRTIQLVKDIDYQVSSTEKNLVVLTDLIQNDILVVNEYYQTYGNFVPNTPSKVGLYPKFRPEVILDTTYIQPTYFIKGHDGSYNKLFGAYNDGYLQDFRDRALFEFETRIYNNIKVDAQIPVEYDDIFPGKFRNTEYSDTNLKSLYDSMFLNWIGINRVDYKTQSYIATNEYTWNYKGSVTVLNDTIAQGNWRGVYLWHYDTATPNLTPWEMLGLSSKPTWWETRYGTAPYTSDNTLLWEDVRDGYVYNDGDPYTNEKRKRPEIFKIIPVDEFGNLRSPFSSIVKSYNVESFKNEWAAGDVGPAEYSYRKSSAWPFDLMRIIALTKPAKFFALGLDLDTYKFNSELGQYLVNNRTRNLLTANYYAYGTNNESSANSYVNWIVDYMIQFGLSGSTIVRDLLLNVDVRLAYRLAGFSDKDMLKFFVEKGSTDNTSTSLMIPDESYSILLYENEPATMISYSSVIIQKTRLGFKIYGNSQTRAYFTTLTPVLNGNLTTVTVNGLTVKLLKDYTAVEKIIPYGTEFTNVTDLCNFLIGYGQYLTTQGMLFNDIENGLELSWQQMVAETMYWVKTGWEVGSTVNVNPCANQITVDKENLIVQPLTLASENYILNQNLIPIQLKDMSVYRNETLFTAKMLNPGDSVGYFNAKMSNVEHIVIFNNTTSFNDLIYNPTTSLRQQRLYVKGAKTAEWNGTVNAAGFIINQNNIQEWVPNQKYTKGVIVKYKNKYWMSQAIISPSPEFDTTNWIVTDYEKIRTGLLPNASNRAFESTMYYDSNRANLENDGDLLGFSLIGYRPRKYMVNADLDDVTQVNVYKNMLDAKGTTLATEGLNNLTVQHNTISYNLHENWAIKTAEFGGIMNQNFVEFTLDQAKLVGNPSTASLVVDTNIVGSQQQVPLYNLKNYGRQINNPKILSTVESFEEKLPNAGYVNLNDVRATGYDIATLNDNIIYDIYKGDYIWIADNLNSWNVYSMGSMDNILETVYNNLDGTATFTFSKPHSLTEFDSIGVLNFSSSIDGYFEIQSVKDLYSVIVVAELPTSINALNGTGLPFKLQYQRVGTARDIQLLPILDNEFNSYKVWVDQNTQGNWTVYERKNRYANSNFSKFVVGNEYGVGTCYVDGVGYFVSDPGVNKLYQYRKVGNQFTLFKTYEPSNVASRFGTAIVHSDKFLIVSDSNPDAFGIDGYSYIHVYKITYDSELPVLTLEQVEQITDSKVGDAMALSGDSNYLYVNLLDYGIVAPYQLDNDFIYTNIGVSLAQATVVNQKSFVVVGNKVNYIDEGKYITFDNGGYETVYTVITGKYDSSTNTTTFYTLERMQYSYASGTTVYTASYHFSLVMVYVNVGDPAVPDLLTQTNGFADQFGYSLATNYDGTKLFIGSPKWNYDNNRQDVGKTWVYDRIVTNVEAQRKGIPGATFLIALQYLVDPGARVYLNNRLLKSGEYLIAVNRVGINGDLVKAGDIITVSTGRFVVMEQLLGFDTESDLIAGEEFGYSLTCNTDGSELLVGSPYNLHTEGTQGAVFRHTNGDKRFGIKTGVIAANFTEPTYFYINGFVVNAFYDISFNTTVEYGSTSVTLDVADAVKLPSSGVLSFNKTDTGNIRSIAYNSVNRTTGVVTFSTAFPYDITFTSPISYVSVPLGNSDNIANQINNSNINNVFAYSTNDMRLVIRLKNIALNPVNDKLNITVLNGNDLYEMGFPSTYTRSQVLTNPHPEKTGLYGYAVKFNEYNSFLVSAPLASRYTNTTFDFTDDNNYHNDTVFDNGFTKWIDTTKAAGAVYMYDYLETRNEALADDKISKYFYAQSINDTVDVMGTMPMYGTSLSFDGYVAMVGNPNYDIDYVRGRVVIYENDEYTQNWSVDKEYVNVVDINKIQKVELYNNTTNENITSLDYFDPLNGKLLGVVGENLDYIASTDPAGYNNPAIAKGNMKWGKEHEGVLWFDTSTTRFINYHQNDVEYDSRYWGAVFPGSMVSVYTWIESDTQPSAYTGPGTVFDAEKYSVSFATDSNSIVIPKYYYWVKNTNILHSARGKTLTDTIVQSYIANPQGSGVAYFAPISQQSFSLYNSSEFIQGTDTNIHIGFSSGNRDSSKHEEFKLIRSNYPTDFLPGLPGSVLGRPTPESLYDRLLDSLSGTDESGAVVPDVSLPKMLQVGISARPRQSMFVNRFKALENYFDFVNTTIAKYAITEIGNASYLSANGEFFNTMAYWSFTYWWETGYSATTRTSMEVPVFADLATIVPTEGLIVGVSKNSNNKREIYSYLSNEWVRVGLEDGTIQFSNKLWNVTDNKIGYGDNYFDSVPFDEYPSVETRYILRALNEQIFVGELFKYRNEGLILLFNYIQSENIENNNYMPWLSKTSLLDVNYFVRELTQLDKYRDDNYDLLAGYINEIKPYHVVIKEFTNGYTVNETYNAGYTDFDLPAKFNNAVERFVTPQLVTAGADNVTTFNKDAEIWSNADYVGWFDNFGVKITDSPNTHTCTTVEYISNSVTSVRVDNAMGIPAQGQFKLGDEIIGYSNVNRDRGIILNLSRGMYNTLPTAHNPGSLVYMDLPGVIVIDTGYRYTSVPTITAWIDTTKYPEPKKPAKLQAVMGDNRVIAVQVFDIGDGYAVQPEIVIDSSYTVEFTNTNLSYAQRTLTLLGAEFNDGDLVKFSSSGSDGILPNGYYYIHVVEAATFVFSLHRTKQDALTDTHRTPFAATSDQTYTLGICALAIANMAGNKVRSIAETIRFDRTSYQPKVVEWTPSTFWSSPYQSVGNDASSSELLYESLPYEVSVEDDWVSPSGGTGAVLEVFNVLYGESYTVEVVNGGEGYNIGDTITIPGSVLDGDDTTNDCIVTVETVGATNEIITISYSGIAVDAILSGIQGAVMPITSIDPETGTGDTLITMSLVASGLKIGQIKGATVYCYNTPATYTYDDRGDNFRASMTTNTLTVTDLDVGVTLAVGTPVHCSGIPAGTTITAFGSGSGGTGTYTVSTSTAIFTGSISGTTLTVTAVTIGPVRVNQIISGTGITLGTTILAFVGIVSGNATYTVSVSQTVSSTTITETIPTQNMNTSGGALIKIHKPRFSPTSVSNQYTMTVEDPGSIYNDGDSFIIPGASLGGTTGTNDAVITVNYALETGEIYISSIDGISTTEFGTFYASPVSQTDTHGVIKLFSTPSMISPVQYTGSLSYDYVYAPEPIVAGLGYKFDLSSLVIYNNKIWSCIESNNDSTFDTTKWVEVESSDRRLNALDRIAAYYQSTASNSYEHLVSGVTYPNATYKGNVFATEDQLPIDIELKDSPYLVRGLTISSMLYDGQKYIGVGDNSTSSYILISEDLGVTWETHLLSNSPLGSTSISYTTEHYVITTTNAATPVFLSYDGIGWVTQGEYTPFDSTNFDITTFDTGAVDVPIAPYYDSTNQLGTSVIVGYNIIATSDSYASWNKVYEVDSRLVSMMNTVSYITSEHFVGYMVVGRNDVIVSGEGTAAPDIRSQSLILTSFDGQTWTKQTPNLTENVLYAVAYNSTSIVVAGENSTVWRSHNGTNWTSSSYSSTPSSETITSMVYGNSKFVGVGTNGFVIVSSDNGLTFTEITGVTSNDLKYVFFDEATNRFVATGTNDTILRSANGISWSTISYKSEDLPTYDIVGSDYQFGYGPEELVAGSISDSINMRVTTSAGSYWDNDAVTQDIWYYNTGFNMVSRKLIPDNMNTVSFDGFMRNPATLAVYLTDSATHYGSRIYEISSVNNPISYSVNWKAQTITLNQELPAGKELLVEVYSIGNGRQLVSGNSNNFPMSVDPDTGNSTFILDLTYQILVTDPVIYANGVKLVYNTDYTVTYTEQNTFKIVFNQLYDQSVDYVVGAIMGNTVSGFGSTQYGYSILDTEVFVGNGNTYTTTLDLSGNNATQCIVEVNGYRLVPYPISGYDYTVDAETGLIDLSPGGVVLTSDDILSISAYNETDRLWATTEFNQSLTVSPIKYVYNTMPALVTVEFANSISAFTDGDEIRIDGLYGSIGLNGNVYFVKESIKSDTTSTLKYYELYSDVDLTQPIDGHYVGLYESEGYVWLDQQTTVITSPAVPYPMPDIVYSEGHRSFTSVNGYRVDPNKIIMREDNKMSICVPLVAGSDYIVTTILCDGYTPDDESYTLTINKNSVPAVYRTNITDGSWLSEPVSLASTTITVNDVTRVVNEITATTTAKLSNGLVVAYVQSPDTKSVKYYSIRNITAGLDIDNSTTELRLVDGRPSIVFDSNVSEHDSLEISIYLGESILLDTERIYFSAIDLETNTISGLIRGVYGSTIAEHPIHTIVYGTNDYVKLDDSVYGILWNSRTQGEVEPLQLSTTPTANFLRG